MQEYKITVVIVGESGVGKTSMMLRYTENDITNSNVTIPIDAKLATLVINGCQVKMLIKDTAGGETFRSMTPSYFRGANGVIYAYDVNRVRTFEQIPFWMNEMERFCNVDNAVGALVGTKTDIGNREVTINQGSSFAFRHHLLFTETSALNADGVDELFKKLAEKIVEKQFRNGNRATEMDRIRLDSRVRADQSASQNGSGNISANATTNVNCFC